jgi:hypothetical protein
MGTTTPPRSQLLKKQIDLIDWFLHRPSEMFVKLRTNYGE